MRNKEREVEETRVKQYSLDALADALESAYRWRNAAEPLRGYHAARREAFERAFGLRDIDSPMSSRRRHLGRLMQGTIESLASCGSPFSGYLEAPRDIIEFGERFGPAIDAADADLKRALRTMLIALLEELVVPGKISITDRDLIQNGFDPSTEAPDSDDFW